MGQLKGLLGYADPLDDVAIRYVFEQIVEVLENQDKALQKLNSRVNYIEDRLDALPAGIRIAFPPRHYST